MKKLGFLILSSFMVFQLSAQTPLDTALDFSVRTTAGDSLHLFEILEEGNFVVVEFMSTT